MSWERLAIVVSCALLTAACSSAATPIPSSRGNPSPPRSATPASSSDSASASTAPSAGTGDLHVAVKLPGAPGDLAVGPDGVLFAIVVQSPQREEVVRFDPATGSLTTSAPLPGQATHAGELAIADGSVWVAGQDPDELKPSRMLFELDARTLRAGIAYRMPAPPVAVVAVKVGVWVAAGRELLLLDPASGRVVRTAPVGGRVTRMATDPQGLHLYVATDTARAGRSDDTVFVEASATTGAILASAHGIGVAELEGPSGLTPTPSGVWVAVPTGLQGSLEFRRSSDLRPTAAPPLFGSNGIRGSLAAGLLWFYTDPTAWLSCADPVTGAIRAHFLSTRDTLFTSDVVSAPSGIYVGLTHEQTSLGSQLMRVSQPKSCRPA